MAGPNLWLKEELGLAIRGAWGAIVSCPWSSLASTNSPVAWRDSLPHWQGFRVRTEQGMGCVGSPAPASH